jgi:hypothetical protein
MWTRVLLLLLNLRQGRWSGCTLNTVTYSLQRTNQVGYTNAYPKATPSPILQT